MCSGGIVVHVVHTRMIHESFYFILCVYYVGVCVVCILCVFYVSCVYPTRAIHADVAITDKVVGGDGGRKSE